MEPIDSKTKPALLEEQHNDIVSRSMVLRLSHFRTIVGSVSYNQGCLTTNVFLERYQFSIQKQQENNHKAVFCPSYARAKCKSQYCHFQIL